MKFLHPQFLWAFAVLLIPIIIHLFNFKRYRTLYFSSLTFVKHVDQQTKATQKLKHLLILATRFFGFTFLVLAFAQPYFSDVQVTNESKNSIMAFYIDNSFSMEAIGSEGELLSEARESVRELIEKSALDTRFIIGTNEMSGVEQRILNKIEALEQLDKIKHTPLIRSLDEILSSQFLRLKKSDIASDQGNLKLFLYSDFQRANGLTSEILSTDNISLYPIKLTPENSSNIYVDSIWFTSPVHKLNSKNELNIRMVNLGENAVENVEVLIDIGEFNRTIYINLPENGTTTTQVGYMEKTIGQKLGKVHVMDNHVIFDDTYYLSYEVKNKVTILLLNGEDAIPNFTTVFDLDDYYNFIEKDITSIIKDDFSEKDLVILNGTNEISGGVQSYLKEFSEAGGSLGLFPGLSPNTGEWNKLLGSLKLPRMGTVISSGNRINTINFDDAFFDGVFENQTDKLNLPSVSTVYRAQSNNSSMAAHLIQLQNGLPLLSYRTEKGSAYMLYSSLHPEFGSFTKDALFSTIVLRMGELSQRKQPEFIIIGDKTRYPIYNYVRDDKPIHVSNETIDFIPQTTLVSGVNYLSLSNISRFEQLRAGNYQIKNEEVIGALSLNYNRNESNLSSYSEKEIVEHLKSKGAKSVVYNEISSKSQLSTINIDKPFSYWKICIVFTLIFVLMEMLIIRFFK